MIKHDFALVETDSIGEGTRIAAFAHISSGVRVGRDCRICNHAVIENDAIIGDRATIGANATILAGITVGARAVVHPGAVVTRDVPPDTIIAGHPGQIVGYVGTTTSPPKLATEPPETLGARPTSVRGVTLHRLPRVEDLRGNLSFGEAGRHVPFEIKRYYVVFDVSGQHIRGEHAHRTLHQFLICPHGSCSVVADDGDSREEFVLDRPFIGLYLPPMIWGVQYKYTADAILLALTSDFYDPADYIRDYSEYRSLIASRR